MSDTDIKLPNINLKADLIIPQNPQGLIVFAHGSGSGRKSPRNQYVANILQQQNLATLLLDLLTEEEEAIDLVTRELRFDISLLAQRLVDVVHWSKDHDDLKQLPIGFFGASTGAAAALSAAATLRHDIYAVISRGGRPDLSLDTLPIVTAPTLLIVGSLDADVIPLNQKALDALVCEKDMQIIDGAAHLFEEPGALEVVAKMASTWFIDHIHTSS